MFIYIFFFFFSTVRNYCNSLKVRRRQSAGDTKIRSPFISLIIISQNSKDTAAWVEPVVLKNKLIILTELYAG